MSDFAVFTQLFDLPVPTVEQWLELLDQPVVFGPEQIERVVLVRFLLDYMKDTSALSLVRRIYQGRVKPIPVFSVVNRSLLDVGDQVYDLSTGRQVDQLDDLEVLTSFAVNLERFARLAVELRDSGRPMERPAGPADAVIPTSLPQSAG